MKHYKVRIKEVGNPHPLETEYLGDIDRQSLIKFYGLNNPDVEWYEIDEIDEID